MSDDRNANVVLTADVSGFQSSMDAANASTQSTLTSVVALNTALGTLTQRAGHKLELIGGATLAGLTGAVLASAKLQSQLTTLRAQSDLTNRSFGSVGTQVNAMRRDMSVTTDQAVALTTQLTKMGQSQTGLKALSETFVKLGAVTGEDVTALADGLISLQRTMGTTGVAQTEKFASSLATVSAKAGVSATSVLSFANAIAPIGKVAGMTQNEITGVSTAFVKAGQDGFAAANAYNKMLTDITRSVQYGSPDLKAYANLIGVSVDQFKQLPRTEAVTEIFEAISKQGPDAIKTLERFGLDGIRTYRALQATAQSGGIRNAIADANDAYTNTKPFQAASKEAMSGLNDELQKMSNNARMGAEAFGSGLLPAVNAMARGINSLVLGPMTKLLEMLGSIPGLATAGAAGGALLIGGLLSQFTRLTAAGAAVSVLRGGLASGFMRGGGFQAGSTGGRVGNWAANYDTGIQAGEGGIVQRGLFRTGEFVGRGVNAFRTETQRSTGLSPSQIASRTLGAGVRGIGTFMRYGLEPLNPQAVTNPLTRRPMFTQGSVGGYASQAAQQVGQFRNRTNAIRGFMANGTAGIPAATTAGLSAFGASLERQTGLFRSLAGESVRLTVALARASTGAVMLGGAGVASGVGRLGVSALRGVGGLLSSALGGPVGIGLAAGMGAMAVHSHNSQAMSGILSDDQNYAAGNKYAEALGQASQATTTFAQVVQANTQKMNQLDRAGATVSGALTISGTDVSAATAPTSRYTDQRMASMSAKDASSFAAATLSNSSITPEQAGLLKMDLVKRFGAAQANKIIANATSGKTSTTDLFGNIDAGQAQWGPFANNAWTQSGTTDAAKLAGDTLSATLSGATGRPQEQNRLTLSAFNQAAKAYQSANTRQGQGAIVRALARGMGITESDTKSLDAITGALGKVRGGSSFDAGQISLASAGSTASQQLDYARRNAGKGYDYNTLNYRPPALDPTQTRNTAIDPIVQDRMRSLGGVSSYVLGNNPLNKLVDTATQRPADTNAALTASNAMAEQATTLTGSFSAATEELLKMKAAVGDVNDPLYQLAKTAEATVRQRQQEAMAGMTRPDRAAQIRSNYNAALSTAAANPDAPEAQSDLEARRQDMVGAKEDARQYFQSIVASFRQYDISRKRSEQDFSLSRSRAQTDYQLSRDRGLHDFNLSQSRGAEDYARSASRSIFDYNLSRKRSEQDFQLTQQRGQEDFARSASRAVFDYTLSRKRAEADFQLSRQRGEQDYRTQLQRTLDDYALSRTREESDFQLQRARGEADYTRGLTRQIRDYNISRTQSIADFQLSRTRAEEDYNHQVVLMAKQAAQQVYDIYNRINVKQTWSASNLLQNMADQQKAITEQTQNLAQARKMGVSGDVIQMMGLNESTNAQQLARFMSDLAANPALVKSFNDMAKTRTKAAGNLAKDQDSLAWQEMRRSFKLSQDRATADFTKGMTRQEQSFKRGLNDMRNDYNLSVTRAGEDFAKSRKRQADDFAKSIDRMRTDYIKQVNRAGDDFNLARDRQATDFGTSMDRMRTDFNTQVSRAQDDFAKQRDRQSTDFARSLERMRKDYNLQVSRATTDFNTARDRQEQDFNTSLTRMKDDFNIQMTRAAQDMQTMATDITGSFDTVATKALQKLKGTAKAQGTELKSAFDDVKLNSADLVKQVTKTLNTLGVAGAVIGPDGKPHVNFANNNISSSKIGAPHGGGSDSSARVVMPLDHYTPTSGFGPRKSPGGIGSTYHQGQDMAAPTGTPIHAAKAGVVTWASMSGGFGNMVKINTGNGVDNIYGHMSAIGTKVGKHVNAGDIIGRVGSTGHSTGPHLHFEVRVDGKAVPPMPFLRGAKTIGTSGSDTSFMAGASTEEIIAQLSKLKSVQEWEKILLKHPSLGSRIPANWLADQVAAKVAAEAAAAPSNLFSSTSGTSGDAVPFTGNSSAAHNRALGRKMAAAKGWNGLNQWAALDWVVEHESAWNNRAQNPSSTAYGLFQFLNSTWAGYGGSKTADPALQLKYGLNYIGSRYGDPVGAQQFWKAHGWYGDGAIFNGGPKMIGVGERGPEAVLPLNAKGVDFLLALMKAHTSDAQAVNLARNSVPTESKTVVYHTQVDRSVHYHGVSVAAKDPMEFVAKMEADRRLKALTGRRN